MAKIPGRHFFHNLVAGRTLLLQLVRRDFKQRFIGSAGGWLWGLVQPLVLLASWTFVFQICLRAPIPPDSPTDNYTLLLFCSFLPWMLFQETVSRCCNSLLENSNLITKTVFPSEIVAIAVFLSALMSHLLALAMCMAAVGIWGGGVSWMAWLLPFYTVLLGMIAVGIGWVVSSLQVYLRDTAQVLNVVLTLWFWVTPIFISEEQVPPGMRFLIHYNPLAYVVKGYRERLLSYRMPSVEEFAALCVWAGAVFVAGGLVFRHLKRGFADVL